MPRRRQRVPRPSTPDSLTNGFGVTASDGWNTDPGFKITWDVSITPKGWNGTLDLYHYVYELTNATGGDLTSHPVSQFGLSVTSNFTMLFPGADARTVTANGAAYSPPIIPNWNGIPHVLFFGFSQPPPTLTIIFDSDRAPVWGDFFAADGVGCSAQNDGLGSDDRESARSPFRAPRARRFRNLRP